MHCKWLDSVWNIINFIFAFPAFFFLRKRRKSSKWFSFARIGSGHAGRLIISVITYHYQENIFLPFFKTKFINWLKLFSLKLNWLKTIIKTINNALVCFVEQRKLNCLLYVCWGKMGRIYLMTCLIIPFYVKMYYTFMEIFFPRRIYHEQLFYFVMIYDSINQSFIWLLLILIVVAQLIIGLLLAIRGFLCILKWGDELNEW